MADPDITALVLREASAEWTRLEERKNRYESSGSRTVELALPEGVQDWTEPEALAVMKAAVDIPAQDRLGFSLGTDQALLRVVDLPSVDREELEGMAELQIDKIAPFPTDQMYLGIEVLSQTEDASRVLIAAAPQSRADRIAERLHGIGLQPVHVDIDVLGWWRLIRDEGHLTGQGTELLMILDGPCAEAVLLQDGQPILFRALDPELDAAQPGDAAELVEELDYILVTLEGQWGGIAPGAVQVWHRGGAPVPLMEALAACGYGVADASLDVLPPLSEGIGRRMAEGTGLNLAPDAWTRQREAKGLQKVALRVAVVSIAVWAVAMGGLLFVAGSQKRGLARAQDSMRTLQGDVGAVRDLQSQVASLEAYGDRTYSGLECLREVSVLLPPGVDLTSFSYRKFGELNLRGEARTGDPIYTFFEQLENSGLFVEVRPEGVTSRIRNNQPSSLFRVTAVLPGGDDNDDEASGS